LKKVLMQSAIAVILGLVLALTPLIVSTEIKTKNDYALIPEAHLEQAENLRAVWGLDAPRYSIADFGVLLACFTIASAVYVFFKRRTLSF